jgi:Flp pilus assembly protein CpaB
VSRRGRAIVFVAAALAAAVAAAAIADGYGASVVRGYGELRPVVVATVPLRAGEPIDAERAADLERRRVPIRFTPVGALRDPGQALGLVPTATVPAGAYLLAAQLRPPRPARAPRGLGGGRRAVQISVAGAAALLAGGRGAGSRVDVVVTTEPTASGPGRTYIAAAAVPLLALSPLPGAGAEGAAAATLALSRRQALRLIGAQSFARQLTLLPGG